MSDAVNHPPHYGGDTTYEVIKVIEAWKLGFCLGNAVKYIARAGKKVPGGELEDLRKAKFYLDRQVRELEKFESKPKLVANPMVGAGGGGSGGSSVVGGPGGGGGMMTRATVHTTHPLYDACNPQCYAWGH